MEHFSYDIDFLDDSLHITDVKFQPTTDEMMLETSIDDTISKELKHWKTLATERMQLLKELCNKHRSVPELTHATPLQQYFTSICATVESFPEKDQIQMKIAINKIIFERELQLVSQSSDNTTA